MSPSASSTSPIASSSAIHRVCTCRHARSTASARRDDLVTEVEKRKAELDVGALGAHVVDVVAFAAREEPCRTSNQHVRERLRREQRRLPARDELIRAEHRIDAREAPVLGAVQEPDDTAAFQAGEDAPDPAGSLLE